MKVLMITPTYPPTNGSHVLRMLKMANVLAESGIEVHVITYEIEENHPQYDSKILENVDKRIKIHRAPIGFLHRRAYSTFKEQTKGHYNKPNKSKIGIKEMIYKFVSRHKNSLLFPDTMIDWLFSVIRFENKRNLINTISPDLILSCSMPSSVHIISYVLHKKYGIPFYLDYADPWVYLGNYNEKSIRFKIERWMEKKILKSAVGYSFSAPGCADLYIEKYNLPKDRVITCMSGYERKLIELSNQHYKTNEYKKTSSLVTFTYGGALHSYVRDPIPFFKALANISDDNISIKIRTDDVTRIKLLVEEFKVSKYVEVDSYIKFNDYYLEMLNTDVILFFGNKNDIQVPGKIFNCIATGKPILYIKSNDREQDTVEKILNRYNRAYFATNSVESIGNKLNEIINGFNMKNGSILNTLDEEILQFSEDAQFGILAKKLHEIHKE
jgi:hypothetical protein